MALATDLDQYLNGFGSDCEDHLRQQQQLTSESKHEKRSDHGGVPPVPVPSNKSDEPIVRKPRNREITSRYKLVSQTAGASHRCSSPDFGRSSHPLELPKRAVSADRRHPTTPLNSDTTSSILLPKSGRKVSKQLWPPDNISASKQMNCTLNGWREENISLKDVNGVQGSTCQNDVSQENAMEPLLVRCSGADQAENLRPIGNFHEKHEASWADIGSNSKRGSYAVSRSLDFYSERQRSGGDSKSASSHIRLNNSSSRNASTKLLARSRNDFSHHVQHSSASENKVIAIPVPQNCDIAKPSGAVDNPESAKGEDFGHLRLLSDEGEMTSSEPSVSSDFEASGLLVGLSVRGAKVRDNKATMRGTIVPARFWQDLGSRMRRFSEGECMGASASETDYLKGSRRTKATSTGSAAAASPPLSPSTLSKSTQFVSSLKELPNLPKTRVPQNGRHMSQSITSSAVLDGRKGRKNLNQQEEAHYLRILQNRLLQWRFVNAQAEFANSSQQAAAESMLCNSWLQTSDLRTSVIEKRIKLQQSRLSMKIESIFSSHGVLLQVWETLHQDHAIALAGVLTALQATILRLPLTRGAKAEIQKLQEVLDSAISLMNDISMSIEILQMKADNVATSMSELAEVAVHERALLEESGDLFHHLAALEVEERSLRTHFVQLQYDQNKTASKKTLA